nr:ribonuclease E/G [Alcaligenaceae bacterium]
MTSKNQRIFINVHPFETRVAIIENNQAQEIYLERTSDKSCVGNIYLGKVTRVLPGIQSAFVDIGLEQAGFLHINDLKEARENRLNNKKIPIEKILFVGQTILVRVIKDSIKNKGPRLSNQINIAGRHLILLPQEQKISLSNKITDIASRERLTEQLKQLLGTHHTMGYIIRSNSEYAPLEEIQADINYLHQQWKSIQHKVNHEPAPSLIYSEPHLVQKILRDICTTNTREILIDSQLTTQLLQSWSQQYTPFLTEKIKRYTCNTPIFDLYQIEQEIRNTLERKVHLKSGGYLIIEQTEALVSIDVNSGRFVQGKNFQENVFKINLEATVEIVRQLRLRNLGGIIIIDFIDMLETAHQEKVLKTLEEQLQLDRQKTQIHLLSNLGTVQMTRKRATESLPQQLAQTCPCCQGNGVIPNTKTICYHLLREIKRESLQFNPKEFRIIASSD